MKMRRTGIGKKIFKQSVAKLLVFLMIFSSVQMLGSMSLVKASSESETRTLNYADSPADNPMKGFVGYRGSGAYSDFPMSMEFVIMPMSDIVVGEGQYDWSVLESYLNEVASYGRQSVVSFYLDNPGTDIGVKAIPQYLLDSGLKTHKYTMGSATSTAIETGYSPDYNDSRVWEMAYDFVNALGAKYDGDPRISTIEASIVGIWGEWHTAPYDFGLEDSDLIQLAKAYDNAFNKTQITARYPKAGTNLLDIGYSDYSFCYETIVDPWSQLNRLKEYNATEYWKTSIGGGELFPSYVKSIFETDNWSLKNGESYEACLQALHPSWLLVGSAHTFTLDERNEAIKAARMLGYDFTVTQATFANDISASTDTMNLSLKIKNMGIAPFYYNWKVKVGVLDENGNVVKTYTTNWDLTKIAADGNEYDFAGTLSNLALEKGQYSLAISVQNPLVNGKKLKFANETQRADGWMVLGDFTVDGYVSNGTSGSDILPTSYDKYGLDVSATDFPEVMKTTSDYFKVGVRIRNYATSNYSGTSAPVLSFYKDGTLVKQIVTNWNLGKINPDTNNYFCWYLKGLGVGTYDIKLQLTSDTKVISLGKMNIVNSLNDINQTEEQLAETEEPVTTPTAKAKYSLDVVQTDVPTESVITSTGTKVGVRICNYATTNYAGTEHPIMNIYKDGTLVKQITTDWDLSKINTNVNYYFCWYVKGLEAGTYDVKLNITSDTQEISLGSMKLITIPTAKAKYNLDVVQTDIPTESVISSTGTKVGVRICNYGTTNYAGTDHPVMNIYKDGTLVKQITTDWDLSKINTNVNYYFCWYVKGLEAGTYDVKLNITSDTQEISLGSMKLISIPTARAKYNLDVTQTDFPAQTVVSNSIKVGVRICNYGTTNYVGTEHPVMNFYKDGTLVKQITTNWDLTKINTNVNYYFCWYVKGLTAGTYNIKLKITSDTQEIDLGTMKVVNAVTNQTSVEGTVDVDSATQDGVVAPISLKVKAGSTKQLTSNSNVTWNSSNSTYATVNKTGLLKANKASGSKIITISAIDKSSNKQVAVYKVTVQKTLIQKIKVNAVKSQKAGKKVSIKVKYTPASYVDKQCSYTSSNKKYATVNSKGVVTLKKAGKGKTVKITVKTLDGSNIKKVVKIKIT